MKGAGCDAARKSRLVCSHIPEHWDGKIRKSGKYLAKRRDGRHNEGNALTK